MSDYVLGYLLKDDDSIYWISGGLWEVADFIYNNDLIPLDQGLSDYQLNLCLSDILIMEITNECSPAQITFEFPASEFLYSVNRGNRDTIIVKE